MIVEPPAEAVSAMCYDDSDAWQAVHRLRMRYRTHWGCDPNVIRVRSRLHLQRAIGFFFGLVPTEADLWEFHGFRIAEDPTIAPGVMLAEYEPA